jgi:hypothetical protein
MPNIISLQRFTSEYLRIKERYFFLLEKISEKEEMNPDDKRFKKIGRIIRRMESSYERNKMFSIKNLNSLERYQMMFSNEQHAVIVQAIELLEKVILHKKLNREY